MKNRIGYKQYVILLWIVIISLFWFQYITIAPFWEGTAFAACIFLPSILIANYLSNKLLAKAIKERRMNRFIMQFIVCCLLLAFLHVTVFLTFAHLQKIGYLEYSELMRVEDSVITEYILALPATIIIFLGFCGLRFYHEHTKLEEVHLKAQLRILQEQINPHFMFNVLNHIYILMQKDVQQSSDLLVKYAEILRYQLYSGKKEFTTLGEEVQFLQDVVGVEKFRWGKELQVTSNWEVEDKDKLIQPLLLMTFIENAFKHVSRSISETGYININFEQKSNNIYLEVENSKSTQQIPSGNNSGLGLKNIKNRLDILYPGKHKLEIEENTSTYIIRLNIAL